MKKSLSLVALAVLSCFQVVNAQSTASKLVVNEIMARNIDMMLDPSYNYGGWIELYNPTSSAISLSGLYISYDKNDLKKVQIPSGNGSVPANGFKTLWFDHYSTGNEYSDKAKNQIDFKIYPEGDTIYISDRNGKLLIEQICPPALARTSYARKTDGGSEWGYTYTPTQGKSNAGSIFAEDQLDVPEVDQTGTVYTIDFDIHVNIPNGATLRYTTDGTTPDLDNGATSEDGVFHIGDQKNYVYRFRLYKDGYLPSEVATHTYIYNVSNNYYLPVVSVVTNPDNLYDNKIGVYVDGTNGIGGNGGNGGANSNKNRGWERPVNFEYLVPNAEKEYCVALNQEVDLELSGGWSRHFPPAPSFKLKTAKIYGKNSFDYPVFSQKPYTKNKAILVRNGGNDCDCRIVDAAIHEIISSSGFYLDCQAYQPTHVFINGKYQFMFNLRETNNKNFAYANYGIDKDEVDQFEYAGGGGYVQKAGDDIAFKKWTNLCNDLSSNPTSDDIWRQICELCDIDEVCNYFATECYVGSEDWVTNNNNTKGFRDRNDGKFHFVFFDVDEAFKRTDLFSKFNANKGNQGGGGGGWGGWGGWGGGGGWFNETSLTDLLSNLLTRPAFKQQFIDTYCVLAGSVFDATRSSEIIHSMASFSEAALALDGKNPWDAQGKYNAINKDISGRTLLDDLTNESKRTGRINALKDFFSLSKSFNVTIQSNLDKATLMLNDVKIPTGKLVGTVFAPSVITAEAPAGYAFKGWKIESRGKTSTALTNAGNPKLDLEKVISGSNQTYITAVFEAIDDEEIIANREETPFAPIRINEVSAGNTIYVNEYYKKNDWIELYNPTDMTLNVAGLYISDKADKPKKYQIPAGNPEVQTFIKPGGKLIIWADKLESEDLVFTNMPLGVVREGIYFSNLHTTFKLSNDEGKDQQVIITWSEEFIANNQAYFEKHPSLKHFADHIVYEAHKGDQTVGRYPDGGNSFYIMNRPTIGQNNSLHSYDKFIGKDTGVKVEEPDDIETILAKDNQIDIRFAGTKLVIQGEATTVQLDIYTIAGLPQQQQTVNLTDGNATIALDNLPAGIYIANVKGANGNENSCKFIIR